MTKTYRKKLLIDLDGVLNKYSGSYQENSIPEMKEGADKFLEKLSDEYEIKIFTTRNNLKTVKWLIENNLDKFVTDVTSVKDSAYLQVDDRCICFKGDFQNTLNDIEKFRVHWKN